MRLAAASFALAAAAVVAAWAWLGAAVEMPAAPLAPGEKLQCVSYAPFRGDQDPFGPDIPIDPRQIDEDLTLLEPLTDCIRTYSLDHGLDQIPAIAQRHGMKVMLGVWVSNLPDLTRKQIERGVALTKEFPDTIQSVVVGNEVLLRGEMSGPALADTIRGVKAQVAVPVTYAEVWEFWLRYREVAAAVDFITIHILPYWEDFPIPVGEAARHVDAIRGQVAAAFPNREILIGEFGWPSAGRMREGALPSPANQARVLQEVVAQAKREGTRINLIEAFDQPWKRQLEGTVGGHWGLFDAYRRTPKFTWGAPVSNHPSWRWQAAGGVAFAAIVFGVAAVMRRRRIGAPPPAGLWPGVGAIAFVSGTLIGWTIEDIPLESLTIGDWLRMLAWAVVAILGPVVAVAAWVRGTRVPSFARLLAHRAQRLDDGFALTLGLTLMALTVLAVQSALGLDFDPRYRDFPFAPLTGAVVPYLVIAMLEHFPEKWTPVFRQKMRPTQKAGALSDSIQSERDPAPSVKGPRPVAETVAAAVLVLSVIYIALNETPANWQALWTCAGMLALAVTLARVRDAPS